MRTLTHGLTEGALFAGIMGFGEGFRRAGFRNLWAVEKESFCRAVIRTRFPETELFEDVRDCGKSNLRAVDVLTAGFPCQDLSVAGKRAGLAGSRSGLFWEVVRILGELRPVWFVLENVPGLFSSNEGRDFAIVLDALDECGYGLAWRVLDSQFFGVAQRRRRVFIVGCFGKPCPQEVLFESEGGSGDFAEGGEERKELAAGVAASLRGVGGTHRGFNLDAEQWLAVYHENKGGNLASARNARALRSGASHNYQFATALSSSAGHHGHSSPRGDGSDNIIVQQAISSKWAKGSSGPAGWRGEDRDTYIPECAAPDSNGVRTFAGLPEGLDSARYRALGNAVTVSVAEWIAERIKAAIEQETGG